MRLSRKASEFAGKLSARVEFWVRANAAAIATVAGREFADEEDIKAAWMCLTEELAKKAHPEIDESRER